MDNGRDREAILSDRKTPDAADSPLFRLLTFLRDWLDPLVDTANRALHREGAGGRWLLAKALLEESYTWVSAGQEVGYFATQDLPEPTPSQVPASWFAQYEVDPATFADELLAAVEDVTPSRRAFLGLMFFERNDVFSRRLEEVAEAAEALSRRPWLSLPPRAVDHLAWALDGADFSSGHLGPAGWRMNADHRAWSSALEVEDGYALPEQRRQALELHRPSFLAATRWYADYEQTPPELRLRPALSRAGETPTEEPWIPSWAQDLE